MIRGLIEGKRAVERAEIKAAEISKLALTGTYTDPVQGIEVEIQSFSKIQNGVELLVRAWKNGKQLGFGTDGSVEVERIRIYNPPILVEDANGPIVRESISPDGKSYRWAFREDPLEAVRQCLAHTIGLIGKDEGNITPGKIGNTTLTFFPDANPESTSVDGRVFKDDASWAVVRGATSGDGVTDTATNEFGFAGANFNSSISLYTAYRYFFLFNTASIPDADTVSSAVLSVYKSAGSPSDADVTTAHVVQSNPASNTALALGDFDAITFASGGSLALAAFSASAGYIDFTLDATGKSWVSKTGVTKLAVINSLDLTNTTPTGFNEFGPVFFADNAGTTQDPKLVVVHEGASSPQPTLLTLGVG